MFNCKLKLSSADTLMISTEKVKLFDHSSFSKNTHFSSKNTFIKGNSNWNLFKVAA